MTAIIVIVLLFAQTPQDPPEVLEPSTVLTGEEPQDRFGETLTLLGDLNRDGYSDFAVGASGRTGEDGPLTGSVYLYSGVDAGMIGSLSGDAPFGRFGLSVTSGDLDGNGLIEIVVGAPYFSTENRVSCGRISLFSFPEAKCLMTLEGQNSSDRFGTCLECMDVNGDGFEDILIGAPGYMGRAGRGSGAVFVYSGLNGQRLMTLEGEMPGAWFGYKLACIDANSDGYGDPVVAAPGVKIEGNWYTGRVYLYSGETGRLLYRIDPNGVIERFGSNLYAMPDLNQDGVQDLAITSSSGYLPRTGIYDGATGGFLYSPGENPEDLSNTHPLVSPGDINGDGVPDLAVGQHTADGNFLSLYSGKDGSLIRRWSCPKEYNKFGYVQCTPLGSDLTGFQRLVLAADPYENIENEPSGHVGIYHLAPPGIVFALKGEIESGQFGHTVKSIGDSDGDGTPDMVVGAPLSTGKAGAQAGRVYLFSGRQGKLLAVLEGEVAGGRLGETILGNGDFDGDGLADFIAAAPEYSDKENKSLGRIYFYSSAKSSFLKRKLTGKKAGDRLGSALVSMGDINGNGVREFLAAAPGDMRQRAPGRIMLLEGQRLQLLETFRGSDDLFSLGMALERAGDLDGNGTEEFFCTAIYSKNRITAPRRVVLVLTAAKKNKPYFILQNPREDKEGFGSGMARIFDLNGDQVDDFLIGAPRYTTQAGNIVGRVYIFSGKDGAMMGHLEGEENSRLFGRSITPLADLDGDKKREIAITAQVGKKGRIYLFSSRKLFLLGHLEGKSEWRGYGCSLDRVDPIGDEDGLTSSSLIVGANLSSLGGLGECGAVFLYGADTPLVKRSDVGAGPKLTLHKPTVLDEGIAKDVVISLGEEIVEPGFCLFLYMKAKSTVRLPVGTDNAVDEALSEQGVVYRVEPEDMPQIDQWIRKKWLEALPKLTAGYGYRIKVLILRGERIEHKIFDCAP